MSSPKILCYINHYHGKSVEFKGRSVTASAEERGKISKQVIDQLQTFPHIDIRICGIPGYHFLTLDIEFPDCKDPTLLVYESLSHMAQHLGDYDYFINMEDDILLPTATLENVFRFDQTALPNEILHPNRVEADASGNRYCQDLLAFPGWNYQFKTFEGQRIRTAFNPHSGILIFSRAKMEYALTQLDLNYRKKLLASGMESAFAYFHSPFILYRSYDNLDFHWVEHLDRWKYSPSVVTAKHPDYSGRAEKNKTTWRSFTPPILLNLARNIRKRWALLKR